ncbi:MAG: hypothetical protein KA149_03215 [Chitinophagales bacterium]|nr:hypothetical protein [Chitinophagales bacterium]
MALLLLAPSFSFSQDAPTPSSDDSTTIEFNKQAKANAIAVGMDTTGPMPMAMPDTSQAYRAGDTVTKPYKLKGRKFYWNAARYNTDDSSLAARKLRRHSPLYASLFSLACPGLGQAYNRKYWKIPIVYAGLGGLGYWCYFNATNFTGYRNAYRRQVAEVPDPFASYKGADDAATLREYRDYYKKNLDISAIITGVFYLLNIVDAAVDAHLFDWNMKDDIHLSWQPVVISGATNYANNAPGVRLNLNF